MHLAHTGITIDLINYISILIQYFVLQIVKERTFRTPSFHLLDRKDHRRQRACRNRPAGNHLAVVFQCHLQFSTCFLIETRTDHQLLLVDIRQKLNRLQSFRMDRFHPDRLPDTGRTGVVAAIRGVLQILFAGCLFGPTDVALHINNQTMCLAWLYQRSNIHGKRGSPTEMAASQNTVDIDFRFIVDRTEIKQNVLSVPFLRDRDRTLIPEMIDKVRISDTGQFTFRAEGNSDLLIKTFRFIELAFHS